MASSEDFKEIHELYKAEGLTKGISIVDFCQRNGIVYSQYEKWYKTRNMRRDSQVHEIRIVDKDNLMQQQVAHNSQSENVASVSPIEDASHKVVSTRFFVTISTSQGLSIRQKNLSYEQLQQLVEKLEVLC